MNYPTMEEVEEASHVQLGRWYRFLESPSIDLPAYEIYDSELEILTLILERFDKLGGWNPQLSKQVGWG